MTGTAGGRTSPIAALFPGYFAMVMATGIVAIGAFQQDLTWLAEALYAVAAAAYVVLLVLTVVRLVRFPRLLAADLTSHAKGFAFLTMVAGTNVLNRFHADTPSDGLVRYSLGGALSTMPVLAAPPEAEDLIYTGFSLPAWPRAQIALVAGGARRVSWNSLSNFVNHVEFSPVVPPIWQAIVHTNGTGQVMEVVDDRPGSGGGLYRIRIE